MNSQNLSVKFADAVYEVRVNALSAVEMCARNTEGIIIINHSLVSWLITGAKGAVAANLVPLCVERLMEEGTSNVQVSKHVASYIVYSSAPYHYIGDHHEYFALVFLCGHY